MTSGNDKRVALLRGINVGGHNKVPMAHLRALAEGLGWTNVRSYIASGNLVFEADGPAASLTSSLRDAMHKILGVDVPVLVVPGNDIKNAYEDCPWAAAGNLVHLFWCWQDPSIDAGQLAHLKAPNEEILMRR